MEAQAGRGEGARCLKLAQYKVLAKLRDNANRTFLVQAISPTGRQDSDHGGEPVDHKVMLLHKLP